MKYDVVIIKSVQHFLEVEIVAADMTQARQKAMEMAPRLDFSGKDKPAEFLVGTIKDAKRSNVKLKATDG